MADPTPSVCIRDTCASLCECRVRRSPLFRHPRVAPILEFSHGDDLEPRSSQSSLSGPHIFVTSLQGQQSQGSAVVACTVRGCERIVRNMVAKQGFGNMACSCIWTCFCECGFGHWEWRPHVAILYMVIRMQGLPNHG